MAPHLLDSAHREQARGAHRSAAETAAPVRPPRPIQTAGRLAGVIGAVFALATLAAPAARGDIEREALDPILRLDLPGHSAEVRALAFAPDGRLVSGGRDKVAMVWDLRLPAAGARDVVRARLREQVIRWQVARGTRGVIQAVAVSPEKKPIIALGGSGAMGSTGEIVVVDQGDGGLVAVLGGGERPGHRGSVVGLDFSVDAAWLFSADVDGQVFAWNRAAPWQPVELVTRDDTRLDAATAAAVARLPALRPLAAVREGRVAVPTLVSPAGEPPRWRVELVDPARPAARRRLPVDFPGLVLAMDATADGRFLAAAGAGGQVAVWDLAADGPPSMLTVTPAAESIALAADGVRIVVGVATKGAGAATRLDVLDVATGMRLSTRVMPAAVRSVAASADGRFYAASGGWNHEILVDRFDAAGDAGAAGEVPVRRGGRRLGGVGRRIGRVAFARQQAAAAPARIGVGVEPRERPADAAGAPPEISAAFDVGNLAVAPVDGPAREAFAPAAGRAGTWTILPAADQRVGSETWQLSRAGRPAGTIPLDLGWQGRLGPSATCVVWLARPGEPEPWAVVLGTDRGLYVHRLVAEGPCPIVRRYRGHEDGVLSLAVSEDGRWLASGGRDGLVMVWPLTGVGAGDPLFERFGVGIRLENGRAVVDSIDEAGPLAGRDVRAGDVLTKVEWATGAAAARAATDGPTVRAALAECDWPTQLSVFTERAGKPLPAFNRLPAWENIASLHLAADREWAWWSPRGYYAASANGDTLFGWLVNRGVDRLPRFFRANQFRRRLERPDVMSRLLAAGSLDAALRLAARDVPKSSAIVLPELIVSTPEVRIVSPQADTAAGGATLRVTAAIDIPAGVEISRVRAYASGVVAGGEPEVLAEEPAAEGRDARRTYAWDLALPDEAEHLVQVFVGTHAGPTDVAEITVTPAADAAGVAPRGADVEPSRRPRLFVLAAGVDRYAHADRLAALGLTNLAFAAEDARSVAAALGRRAAGRYDLGGELVLHDERVTRPAWREALETLAARVAEGIRPDDLVVIFLAGHGMIDDDAGREYCYLCHDVDLTETAAGAVPGRAGSITWRDFAPLDRLPCRKLALVDTCHSGGLRPAARSTGVREFQENMILVVAAASDEESSQESATWGHGAFTASLLEALDGRADVRGLRRGPTLAGSGGGVPDDTAPDGLVTLTEIADYVATRVPALTAAAGAAPQHPTVSPAGLLPFVTLPLAAEPQAKAE